MFMFLHTIEKQDVFLPSIPLVPRGKYVHFVVLRETSSFPLFQTDQELNFARVTAGRSEADKSGATISRVVIFKRKQTTPERLTGRELLRRYGLTTDEESGDA